MQVLGTEPGFSARGANGLTHISISHYAFYSSYMIEIPEKARYQLLS